MYIHVLYFKEGGKDDVCELTIQLHLHVYRPHLPSLYIILTKKDVVVRVEHVEAGYFVEVGWSECARREVVREVVTEVVVVSSQRQTICFLLACVSNHQISGT